MMHTEIEKPIAFKNCLTVNISRILRRIKMSKYLISECVCAIFEKLLYDEKGGAAATCLDPCEKIGWNKLVLLRV